LLVIKRLLNNSKPSLKKFRMKISCLRVRGLHFRRKLRILRCKLNSNK
jgi:hypothetical protein